MKQLMLKKPYPKQKEFMKSRKRYTAYGGARGGGKSQVARMKAELLCLKYAGIQVLFMRRTYPELKENHLLPAMKELNGIAKYSGVNRDMLNYLMRWQALTVKTISPPSLVRTAKMCFTQKITRASISFFQSGSNCLKRWPMILLLLIV